MQGDIKIMYGYHQGGLFHMYFLNSPLKLYMVDRNALEAQLISGIYARTAHTQFLVSCKLQVMVQMHN